MFQKLIFSALVLVMVSCSHKSNPVAVQPIKPTGIILVSVVLGTLDSAIITDWDSLNTTDFEVSIGKDTVFYVHPIFVMTQILIKIFYLLPD